MPAKKKGNTSKGNSNSNASKKQQSQSAQPQKTKTTTIKNNSTTDNGVYQPENDIKGNDHHTDVSEHVSIPLEHLTDIGLSEEDVAKMVNSFPQGMLVAQSLSSLMVTKEDVSEIIDRRSVARLSEELLNQDWSTPPFRPLCDGVTPSQTVNVSMGSGISKKAAANTASYNTDKVVIDNENNVKVPTAALLSFITAMVDRQEMKKHDEMSESPKQRGAADVGGNSNSDKSPVATSNGKTSDNTKKDPESSTQFTMSSINKLIETMPTNNLQAIAKLFTESTASKRNKISEGVVTPANKNGAVNGKQGEASDKLKKINESDKVAFVSSDNSNEMNPNRQTFTVDVSAPSNNEVKLSKSSRSGDSLSSFPIDLDDEELSGTTGSSIITDGSDEDADGSQGVEAERRIYPGGIPQADLDQMIYMIEKLSNLSLCTVKSICDQWGIGKEASVAVAAATTENTEELKSNASWVPLFYHALERQQNQQLLRSGQSVRNKQLKTATRKEEQENQLYNLYYRSTIVHKMRHLSASIVICHAEKCNLLKGSNDPSDQSKILNDFVLTLWCRILNLDARTRSSFSSVLGFTESDPSGEDMCIVVMAAGIAAMLSPLPIPLLHTICSEIGGHCRGPNEPLIDPTLSEGDPDFLHELPVIRLCQELYPRLDEIPVLLNAILHLSVPTVHENGPGSFTCTVDSAMMMTRIPKQTQVSNNFSCMNNVMNPLNKEKVRWRAQIVVKEGVKIGGEETNRLCFHMWHHSPHTHKIHLSVRSKGATPPSTNNKGKKQLINTPAGTCTSNSVVNAFNANTGCGITLGGTGPLYVSHTFLVEPNAVVGFSNLVPIDVIFNQLPGYNGSAKSNGGANNSLRLYSIHDDRISFQFTMEITETIPAKIPILSEAEQQKFKRISDQSDDREDKVSREIITPVGKGGKKQVAHQEAGETIRDLIAEEQRYAQLAKEQKQKIKEEKKFKALESQTEPKGREKITQQFESAQQNIDSEIKKSWDKCLAKKKESDRKALEELEKPNELLIAKLTALQQTTHANRTHVTKLSQDKNKVLKDFQKVTSQLEQRSKELEQLKERFEVQSKELEVIEEVIELTRIRIDKKKKIIQMQREAALQSAHMNAFSPVTPSSSFQQLTAAPRNGPPQPLSHLSNNTRGTKKQTIQQRVTVGGKSGHSMPLSVFQTAQGRGPPPSIMSSGSTYLSSKTTSSSNHDQLTMRSHPVDSKADVDQFWETAKKDPVALTTSNSPSLNNSSVPGKQNGATDSGSFAVVSSSDISTPSSHSASQLFATTNTTGGGLGSFSITSSNLPGGTSNNNAANMIFSSVTGGSSQQSSSSVTPSGSLSNNLYYHGNSNATVVGSTPNKIPNSMYSDSSLSYLVRDDQQNGSSSSTPFSTNPSASGNISAIHHSVGSSSTGFVSGGSKYTGLSFSTRAGSSSGGIGSSNIGNPFSTIGRHSPHHQPPPPLTGSSGGSFYVYGNNNMMKRGISHGSGGATQVSYANTPISRPGGPIHNNVGTFYGTGGNGYTSHSSMGPGAVGQGNGVMDQGNGSGGNSHCARTPTPSFHITANAVNIENMFSGNGSSGSW